MWTQELVYIPHKFPSSHFIQVRGNVACIHSYSYIVSDSVLGCLAPSPPRDVTVRLVAPTLAEVRWRTPAVSNGNITHYTVYAIPLRSIELAAERQTEPIATTSTIQMVITSVVL